MRVILDTNVLVAAVRSRHGASAALLELLVAGAYSIALSAPLAFEYEEALVGETIPEFASQDDVEEIVRFVCAVGERYDPHAALRPALRDPDDNFILDLAVEARVNYIVTHNVRDFAAGATLGTAAIAPGRFLSMLRGRP